MRMTPTNKVLTLESTTQLRSVKGGVEGTEEPALLSRTETLRCEIHCRKVSDEMRVNLKAPRAAVTQIIVRIGKAAANTK